MASWLRKTGGVVMRKLRERPADGGQNEMALEASRQRASRSRSSSEAEPFQFNSVNVREAFTEASWVSNCVIWLFSCAIC
jgi:hypothetical protein